MRSGNSSASAGMRGTDADHTPSMQRLQRFCGTFVADNMLDPWPTPRCHQFPPMNGRSRRACREQRAMLARPDGPISIESTRAGQRSATSPGGCPRSKSSSTPCRPSDLPHQWRPRPISTVLPPPTETGIESPRGCDPSRGRVSALPASTSQRVPSLEHLPICPVGRACSASRRNE